MGVRFVGALCNVFLQRIKRGGKVHLVDGVIGLL